MRSLNDYFLIFPDLIDTANAGVTSMIPVPDGGRLSTIMTTEELTINVDEDLTFSTLKPDGTAVAVTTGVVTIDAAGAGTGRTKTFHIGKQSDGTDVVPPGGALQMANDSAAITGKLRVAVILRR